VRRTDLLRDIHTYQNVENYTFVDDYSETAKNGFRPDRIAVVVGLVLAGRSGSTLLYAFSVASYPLKK
jgi:hypothetical protein